MKRLVSVLAIVLMVQLLVEPSEATLSCDQIRNELSTCVPYLIAGGGRLPDACCVGVSNLNNLATTKQDRQAICSCMQNPKYNPSAAEQLPYNCRVHVTITIYAKTKCQDIE